MTSEPNGDVGPGLTLSADFELILGSLSTQLKRANDKAERDATRERETLPRQLPMVRQSDNPTVNPVNAILDFGGPSNGREWVVRILGAYSILAGAFVTMAGTTVSWFVGQPLPAPTALIQPSQNLRWQFPSIPNFKDLSGDQLKILPGERLLAVLNGIPAAPTSITALAVINDSPLYTGRPVVQA
jgi:hypothetical protein